MSTRTITNNAALVGLILVAVSLLAAIAAIIFLSYNLPVLAGIAGITFVVTLVVGAGITLIHGD